MIFMETHTNVTTERGVCISEIQIKNPAVILNENFVLFLEHSRQLQ
jgi:hypothetical protein